jgi:hypothetical protein
MYFKVSMRTNPETKIYLGYYRLVESYRTNEDRVYYRTILNAGYLDELDTDQLNLVQKILTAKVTNHDQPLFELPYTDDTTVLHYVEKLYNRMVAEKRIDVGIEKQEKKVAHWLNMAAAKKSEAMLNWLCWPWWLIRKGLSNTPPS